MQKVEYDYEELVKVTKDKLGTKQNLASKIGMSKEMLSRKLHNKSKFCVEDIQKICNVLNEPYSKIPILFFKEKVR